ncbi:MAG: tRNA 2-thiouridine(34) synthase MnmA, partial [Eubacteriales bacterium]|nr:tRNA 2-thiouridine(34) synthase MnmA [Eubacteriales bacterium]
MNKVVLGFSGGVDSAVSAKLLLSQGYEVIGLHLLTGPVSAEEEARSAAEYLGIPLFVRDVRPQMEEFVCRPFAESYRCGETPNPCVICNPAVKFRSLCDFADEIGAPYISTGHYARSQDGGIYRGSPDNDQSYMLSRLTRSQAARLLLPLGPYKKTDVRALAADYGLAAANKPDSMEICFIPDKDYIGWLERRGVVPPPGNFLFHGECLGQHEGIHRYTVGQRRPGLYNERKLYVSEICPETGDIVLALWEELFRTEFHVRDLNWLIPSPEDPVQASVKVRHTKWECPPCTVFPDSNGGAVVR